MNPVPMEERIRNEQIGQEVDLEFSIGEGMRAAADEAVRASVGSSLVRFATGLMDDSDQVDPLQANEEYGLEGTEFAFKPDETVTADRAKAVAADFHRIRRNDFIQETVNEDAPVVGRVSQFAAGIVGGMVDPATLALSAGGTFIAGKALAGIVSSERLLRAGGRFSKPLADKITRAYSTTLQKNASDIILREGAENFVGSIAEETVNFVGLGEERLARKVTAEESVINIVAGTFLGTALGTVAGKEGRQAIGRSFGRKYGDQASDVLKADAFMTTLEVEAGLPPSGFAVQQIEADMYSPKEWHETKYAYSPVGADVTTRALYLPVREDGSPVLINTSAKGTVLTDNVNQAYNVGSSVIEVDASQTRVMTRNDILDAGNKPTVTGVKLYTTFRKNLFGSVLDKNLLSTAVNVIKNPAGGADAPRIPNARLEAELGRLFDGKDLDEVADIYTRIRAMTKTKDDFDEVIGAATTALGFDGYHYTGKTAQGQPAYNAVAFTPEAASKLARKNQVDSPRPNETQKAQHSARIAEEQMNHVRKIEEQVKNTVHDPVDAPPVPEDYVSTTGNQFKNTITVNKQTRDKVAAVIADMERRFTESPDSVTPAQKRDLELYKAFLSEDDIGKFQTAEADSVLRYVLCTLGG